MYSIIQRRVRENASFLAFLLCLVLAGCADQERTRPASGQDVARLPVFLHGSELTQEDERAVLSSPGFDARGVNLASARKVSPPASRSAILVFPRGGDEYCMAFKSPMQFSVQCAEKATVDAGRFVMEAIDSGGIHSYFVLMPSRAKRARIIEKGGQVHPMRNFDGVSVAAGNFKAYRIKVGREVFRYAG